MSQMKELYEKVAKNPILQQKFSEILTEAEAAGKDATEEKLLAFSQTAGFSISLDEMKDFFQELQEKPEGELSVLQFLLF